MRRTIAATLLVMWHTNTIPGEALAGRYSTVSEADCRAEIVLRKNGTGTLTEECRAEGPNDVDEIFKQNIRWRASGSNVTIINNTAQKKFKYHRFLLCDSFGEVGSRAGLVGNGEKFWKKPIKCR